MNTTNSGKANNSMKAKKVDTTYQMTSEDGDGGLASWRRMCLLCWNGVRVRGRWRALLIRSGRAAALVASMASQQMRMKDRS